ncbi:hypothetical protein QEP21_12575 [Pseudomonas shirazica]|nr:hypothetical protein [Pseudomonas shirazica]MDH4431169.1 hypothetical protein [Pseudomonas shirazica]
MTISQRIALAIAEAGLPHDQCMFCERQGLPILPLRRALVPDTRPECVSTVADNRHISTKIGLRTLRRGFLCASLRGPGPDPGAQQSRTAGHRHDAR